MEDKMISVINHTARKRFKLTVYEYLILDIINKSHQLLGRVLVNQSLLRSFSLRLDISIKQSRETLEGLIKKGFIGVDESDEIVIVVSFNSLNK